MVLFLVFLITIVSFAQDTVKIYYLGEIEVTAYRAGGEVLNLPMAVSSIDRGDLVLKRMVGLSDVLNSVPGVLAQSRAGASDVRLTIRGFGSRGFGDKSNAATIRGIKILVDGFPETEPDGRTSLDFVDLLITERIEVIRTNTSTLFGNASGGIINFETFRVAKSFFELNGVAGSFGLTHSNVKIGLRSNGVEFLLTGTGLDFAGWRENSSTRKRQVYSTLKFKPSSTTQFKLITGFSSHLFYIPGPLTHEQFTKSPSIANELYLLRKERRYNRVGKMGINFTTSLNLNHNFDLRLYFEPKVLQRSERNTFRDFNRYFFGGGFSYQYFNDEAKFKPKLVLGYDDSYQDGTILFYNLVNGERGDSLRTNKREGGRSGGFFIRFEIQPFEKVFLAGSGRYDFQKYISEIYPAGAKIKTMRDILDLKHFTPSLSILLKVNENNTAYLTLSGGVEAPAFNEVDPPPELKNVSLNPLLKPMASQTYELGFKGLGLFDVSLVRSFMYSFSFFRILVKNEIVPYENGKWFFSAGKSERKGFEISTRVDFKFVNCNFALTYIDAKYLEYENDLGNHSGKTVPGIPKLWWNANLNFNFKPFVLNAEIIHSGRYFADDLNEIMVSSYTILNLSILAQFKIFGVDLLIRGGVNNLTDEKYISSVFVNPGREIPYSFIEPGLPRNIFGGVSVKYTID